MRYRCRQPAGNHHAICATQGFLRFAFAGNVTENQHHAADPPAIVPDGRGAVFDRNLFPIVALEHAVIRQSCHFSSCNYQCNGILSWLPRVLVENRENFVQGASKALRRP